MSQLFLQQYWWFLVSLLGGLLVFLLFVQGGGSLIFCVGRTPEERSRLVSATGRKWELTFTTLVTFGGAFFASFPLFYSTSFGGAYWVWMLILCCFVLQAVSYEFQAKQGAWLSQKSWRRVLAVSGLLAPLLIGMAVGTFFNGAAFTVDKSAIGALTGTDLSPVISRWANNWHGLDALANPWNWVLGLTVMFLARVLGAMYMVNNLDGEETLRARLRRRMLIDGVPFALLFVAFLAHVLTMDGLASNPETGVIAAEPFKYLHNALALPAVTTALLIGAVLVLTGMALTFLRPGFVRGIWLSGTGTVLAVLGLLLLAGLNNTAYYPSTANPASSLTIENSSSGLFTLQVMSVVSLLIPFVLAYIFYAWRAIDKGGMKTNY
ncbi:MAG: cytochrome d ubiquinol oxidase subunit II [Bacteroidales bacterium]|nr:cytochrome d ubiquinol oxidase subunit II [Bacteroidales bacterium]